MKIVYLNIDTYRELGYDCNLHDVITVKIEHLAKNSNKKVDVICEVCGEIRSVKYQDYNKGKRNHGMYVCSKCAYIKNEMTNLEKYGVKHAMQVEDIREKSKRTCMEKYGAENISQTTYFEDKYKSVMNEKYGVDNYFQSHEFQDKRKDTCLERYGYEHHKKSPSFKEIYLMGENNPSYIDGRSKTDRGHRDICGAMYREWRSAVFERDSYTCKFCGDSTGGNLNAHHMYSYVRYKDAALNVDNGITLCKECHKFFHTVYGYGENNEKQYIEWINTY